MRRAGLVEEFHLTEIWDLTEDAAGAEGRGLGLGPGPGAAAVAGAEGRVLSGFLELYSGGALEIMTSLEGVGRTESKNVCFMSMCSDLTELCLRVEELDFWCPGLDQGLGHREGLGL